MIDLYCGINETTWNELGTTAPGALACIAPVYGSTERTQRSNSVSVPADTLVIQDSGAFSDGPLQRLSFSAALARQLTHSDRYGYTDQISHRASYDLLIDEVWTAGNRAKRRWSENDAWAAVAETVDAAAYLASHYTGPRIQSAQGVTAGQYRDCVVRVLEWFDTSSDVFGLGGWCIIGKMPAVMMPTFAETISDVIPLLAKAGVKRIHIWGVMYATALGQLLWLCDQHGLQLSTDSAGPSMRPALGEWGYADWRQRITPPPLEIRGAERARHVRLVRDWLGQLRYTKYYTAPIVEAKQLYFF